MKNYIPFLAMSLPYMPDFKIKDDFELPKFNDEIIPLTYTPVTSKRSQRRNNKRFKKLEGGK